MRILPSLIWCLDGEVAETLDARLLPLLEAIATSRSLAAAVAECGISYRAAWGLLRDYQGKLGVALVLLERGRGASLTEAGERLVAAHSAANEKLARALSALAMDIGPKPRQKAGPPSLLRLRVAASHDLALAALAQALPESGLSFDLSFMGSLIALKEFAEGRADVAGFHVPVVGCATLDLAPFLKLLRTRRDRLVRFADREQGLIVPRGNPHHVKTLRDIASRRLRFVNRQRGSGTRLLIDQMIADGKLDSSAIHGYHTEEFTHAAVAATVASGGADAGFGLRAAAAEYGLGFVSLVRERYFFALRAKELGSPAAQRLIEALKGPALARAVRPLPGYQIAGAGSMFNVDALVPAAAGGALSTSSSR